MTDFIKKSCAYSAGTLTFLIALKANFGIAAGMGLVATVVLLSVTACITIAWLELRRKGGLVSGGDRDAVEDGSVSLTLRRALACVRFAARNDESVALLANKIVRRGLDKHCISYADYRRWREKNSSVFTAITGKENNLLGFFDIFPLTEEAAKGLLNGRIREHDLTSESIVPADENLAVRNIYIASLMVNPRQRLFSRIVANEVVVLKCLEYLIETFPPNDERMILAYAQTDMGERLLKNAAFTNTTLAESSKQRRPLYQLSPTGYRELAETFAATSGIRARKRRKRGVPDKSMQTTPNRALNG